MRRDGFAARWATNALVLLLLPYVVPGVHIAGIVPAVMAALVIGLANATVRPLLVVLSLPLEIATLGLFTLVINGVVLYLAAAVVRGFSLAGFGTAVIAALVLSVASAVLSAVVRR